MQTLISKVSTELKKLPNNGDHEVDELHVRVGMVCIQLTYTHNIEKGKSFHFYYINDSPRGNIKNAV